MRRGRERDGGKGGRLREGRAVVARTENFPALRWQASIGFQGQVSKHPKGYVTGWLCTQRVACASGKAPGLPANWKVRVRGIFL